MQSPWQLVDGETGRVVVSSLELADGYWSRLVGWQLRRRPENGHGLLLVPCSSIHTCFLRFPLDLVLFDSQGKVIAVRTGVRPWRLVLPARRAHAILELPSGGPGIQSVKSLRALGIEGQPLPKSLRFLSQAS